MKKYLIHWFEWECDKHKPHHNYTNARGFVNCPRCLRRVKAAQATLSPGKGQANRPDGQESLCLASKA